MTYPTPLEVLLKFSAKHPDKPLLHQPVNREWLVTTWKEAEVNCRRVAAGLESLGLMKGDKVAILAKNSAEWFMADWAIMMAGMISVPIYATAGESTIKYILEHSEAKAIFLGKLDDRAAANASLDGSIPRIAFPYPTAYSDHKWSDWLTSMTPKQNIHASTLDETMSIVYTSGSTGNPKGVVISYLNYSSVCETHANNLNFGDDERLVSYLPLAHITERGVIQGPGLYGGATFYFVESLDTFVEDLKVARPTLFLSVPRLWTRFQSGVFEKMPAKKLAKILKVPILGGLIAKKIRKGLGINSAHLYGSGSAPIAKSILEWYQDLGVELCEGWGMTETSGLSCANMPFQSDLVGTIGKPFACVEMKLSDLGEILIRGDAVFKEYFKNPEVTEASFVDGWFRTGDKARKLPNGAYEIIGRVKEEFKTGKGKYVAPVPIESMLAANPDMEQLCVMGSGRKQPVGVVVLAEHVDVSDKAAVQASLEKTLASVNAGLESHQQLDCLIIAEDSWTIENEFLTPTMKIRRSVLEDRYNKIAQMSQDKKVVWEHDVTD